jgi:hypothetical protein
VAKEASHGILVLADVVATFVEERGISDSLPTSALMLLLAHDAEMLIYWQRGINEHPGPASRRMLSDSSVLSFESDDWARLMGAHRNQRLSVTDKNA